MKKHLIVAAVLVTTFAVWQVSAQTISLTGTSGTINAGNPFTSHITLTISGTNTIGNVESVNFLLGTPTSGPNSGAADFTITLITPTSPFTTANASPATATFGTAGDAANSGSTVTTNTSAGDVGSFTTSPATVAASGTTSFEVETITFQSLANTPAGTYNFYVTSGGQLDAQGSYIANSGDTDFDITGTPVFTITVVPEPATLSLLGLSGLGSFGMTLLRRRRS